MSELMANPNGHLQVINVIHGCHLTSHLNNHSLWNTNQTASPWCTDYFIPLIWGFIRGQRQQKRGWALFLWLLVAPNEAIKPTNAHYASSRQRHGDASFSDNEKSVFLSPWQVYFSLLWCVAQSTRNGPNECHVGDLMSHLEPTSVRLPCVASTDGRFSVSNMFCSTSPQREHFILMMSPSVTRWSHFHLRRSPEVQMLVDVNTLPLTHICLWFVAFDQVGDLTNFRKRYIL